MLYREARDFLAKHTDVVELIDKSGARVAICPEWQGRVMTSTYAGDDGPSFGFINSDFIQEEKPNPHFNNYGGEDRMWLSPEAGQFGLWFKPGAEQHQDNCYTPPALNEGAWEVLESDDFHCLMGRKMELLNASATEFDLAVKRDVRLLGPAESEKFFGKETASVLAEGAVKMVAYETVNTITNEGPPMTKEKGLVSIWSLGMFPAGSETVIIVPYKSGDKLECGPIAQSYFGPIPSDRLKIVPEAILIKGDGKFRSKTGTSQRRARNALGSIDFHSGTLTVVSFSMPADPTKHDYMNNLFEVPLAKPYVGDVVNVFNTGSATPGEKGSVAFYEMESLSPAVTLDKDESLTHTHRIFHFQGDQDALAKLAVDNLGIDLERVREKMTVGKRLGY